MEAEIKHHEPRRTGRWAHLPDRREIIVRVAHRFGVRAAAEISDLSTQRIHALIAEAEAPPTPDEMT